MNLRSRLILSVTILLGLLFFLSQGSKPIFAQAPTCAYADQVCDIGAVREIAGELKRCTANEDYTFAGWLPCNQGECQADTGRCVAVEKIQQWFRPSHSEQQRTLEEGDVNVRTWLAYVSNSLADEALYYTDTARTQTIALSAIMIEKPPAKTQDYLAFVANKVGIEPVYAQGTGFVGLNPILKLWQLFRNIAYLFYVIIFAVVGLMIILRKRIDPRTVVTVQDSLPRIIVSLLLVTFSYAIAGVIIDTGQLAARVVGNLFQEAGFIAYNPSEPESKEFLNQLFTTNIFKLINPLRNVDQLLQGLGDIDFDIGIPGAKLFGVPITARLVFQIGGFVIMLKIFFTLLGAYVEIVLSVILGPLKLMLAALPSGSNEAFSWVTKMFANVMVFPVTFTMLIIAATLKSNFVTTVPPWVTKSSPAQGFWSPPSFGDWGNVVGELLAYGILFTIPRVVDLTKEALAVKESRFAGAAAAEMKSRLGGLPFVGGALSR